MKYILIFLLSFPAMAEVLPSTLPALSDVTIQREGSKVTLEFPGYCYWVDATQYEKIPTTKTPITQVIIANLDVTKPCGWVPVWVIAKNKTYPTRPLYSAEPWKAIGTVKIGRPCEDSTFKASTGGKEWRYTTNASGQRGLAVCEVLN